MNKLTYAYVVLVIYLYLFVEWLRLILHNITFNVLAKYKKVFLKYFLLKGHKIKMIDVDGAMSEKQHLYDLYQLQITHDVTTLQRFYRGHRSRQVRNQTSKYTL